MSETVECAGVPTPWYHWHRFALLPNLKIRKADKYNCSSFRFHWLFFRAWSGISPEITLQVTLDDQQLQIRFSLPYIHMGFFIPLFPWSFHQKLWRVK